MRFGLARLRRVRGRLLAEGDGRGPTTRSGVRRDAPATVAVAITPATDATYARALEFCVTIVGAGAKRTLRPCWRRRARRHGRPTVAMHNGWRVCRGRTSTGSARRAETARVGGAVIRSIGALCKVHEDFCNALVVILVDDSRRWVRRTARWRRLH